MDSHLREAGAVVGEGHCSGPAASSGSRSAGGDRSALSQLGADRELHCR